MVLIRVSCLESEVSAVCFVNLNVLSEYSTPAISIGKALKLCEVTEFFMFQHVLIEGLKVAAVGCMRTGEELEMQTSDEGTLRESKNCHLPASLI